MQFPRTKILLSLLIFILAMTSQACLFEQAIALVVKLAPQEHHRGEAQEHHQQAPSHKHDNEGQESKYCCDNSLNQFVASKGSSDFQSQDFITSVLSLTETTTLESSNHTSCIRNLKQSLPFRSRDKYALSCLLHAPPSC